MKGIHISGGYSEQDPTNHIAGSTGNDCPSKCALALAFISCPGYNSYLFSVSSSLFLIAWLDNYWCLFSLLLICIPIEISHIVAYHFS